MKQLTSVILLLGMVTTVAAQINQELLIEHYNKSRAAYDAQQYEQFLYHCTQADSISPNHPTLTYNLAAAYALNNLPEKSLHYLQKVVLMNTNLLPDEDPDFKSIKTLEGYEPIEQMKAQLEIEVAGSEIAFTNPEKDLHPESIAYDQNSGQFFMGSVHKNKIVRYDPKKDGFSDWKVTGEDGLWAVMGMKVDAARNHLWVCSAATPEMANYDSTLEGKTAIYQYSLENKKLLNRYEVAGGHWFGDLVIDKSGSVYISDSREPIIYQVENGKLEVFKDFTNELFNLQGLCFNETGNVLFIADYKTGLYGYNLDTKVLQPVTFPTSITTKGVDGLYFFEGNLIATQNGVRPFRVCRYKLNEQQNEIIDYEYIDKARELLDEPTLGVIVENDFYYIANSPWGRYDKKGNLIEEKLTDNIVLKYSLK